jgi:citrate synthase
MKGPKTLLKAEDHWVTSLGAFIPSEGRVVMHGKDLHHDLTEMSWMDLLMFAICGRRLPAAQVELFQGLWKIGGSYPEPRIWNNRVSALAGSARTTPGLGLSGAIAVSDARIFGRGPDLKTFDFLSRARLAKDAGESLHSLIDTELRQQRVVAGYGRPLRSEDERIQPMLDLAKRLGLDGGPHLRVAFEVRDVLAHRRMGINAAAVGAALCADQGLTHDEYYYTCLLMFSIGLIACEYDARRHLEGSFMPVRCVRIEYRGPAPRSW